MLGTSKTISSIDFWVMTTTYLITSLAAFLFTAGGYRLLYFLIVMGSFYLIAWLFVAIICLISKKVRYTPALIYPILFIQIISILFNFGDSGYYGVTCHTKNFIQQFLDSTNCGKLWVDSNIYSWIIVSYLAVVTIFAIDVVRLGPIFDKNSK